VRVRRNVTGDLSPCICIPRICATSTKGEARQEPERKVKIPLLINAREDLWIARYVVSDIQMPSGTVVAVGT